MGLNDADKMFKQWSDTFLIMERARSSKDGTLKKFILSTIKERSWEDYKKNIGKIFGFKRGELERLVSERKEKMGTLQVPKIKFADFPKEHRLRLLRIVRFCYRHIISKANEMLKNCPYDEDIIMANNFIVPLGIEKFEELLITLIDKGCLQLRANRKDGELFVVWWQYDPSILKYIPLPNLSVSIKEIFNI